MGLLASKVGQVAGSYWPAAFAKKVLSLGPLAPGEYSIDTGIIMAPTAGQWAMYEWHWDALEAVVGSQMVARKLSGFLLFSPDPGTPAARFGGGTGSPGWQGNGGASYMQSYNYSRNNTNNLQLTMNGSIDRPFEVLVTGELRLWVLIQSDIGQVKGVLTIGEEAIFDASAIDAPPVP